MVLVNLWWYWQTHKEIEWNRFESLEINAYIYGQLIVTRVPSPFNSKRVVSSIAETTGFRQVKEQSWTPTHTIYKN